MTADSLSEADVAELLTGLVVESLAVKQDFATATIGCRQCDETLSEGDAATVATSCYENYSWEIEGIYCADHGVDSVGETMDVRAEHQAVVETRLETAGYHTPRGDFEPEALTLGTVEMRDYSPTADGY